MNRKIRFRGKVKYNGNHKFSGDWVYGYYRNNDNGNAFITETLDEYSNYIFDETEVDESTIGQFTGLIDKNGARIYEGDIVKGNFYGFPLPEYDYIFEIYWDKKEKGFMASYFEASECEVIGNIYDNPELIEKEGK